MDTQAQNAGGLEFVPVCAQHNLGRLPEASIRLVPVEEWDICSMKKPDGSRCGRMCRTLVPADAVTVLE